MARLGPTGLAQVFTDIKNWVLSKIPTKTSQLTNDSNYLTSHQSLSNYSTLANTVKSISISGKTITVTPGSGSAYTLTTQDTNTDTLVTQNVSTTNSTYPILLCATADATANQGAKTSIFGSGVKVNPSTSTITATTFSGALTGNVTGNCSGSSGSCTGNASTATQFSANKSVTLTGDVTGTASSKAGWSVATTLANSGVTAGTYGPSADVTGNNNATISVPEITVDSKGRVTSVANRTLTCKNNTYNVYNKTLTIQKNGTNVATFTSNSNTDVTANITVPTKVSELTNDSGFLTSHQSLSNYVTLNGAQTISGEKTLSANLTIAKSGPQCFFKDTRGVKGTAPSSNIWNQFFYVRDNNNVAYGGLEHGFKTTKENRMNLIVYPGTTDNTSANAQISVGFDSNGNAFTYAPTPDASSNTTQMATTAWVRTYAETTKKFLTSHQSLSNYSTLANTVKSLSISGKTITVTPGSGSAYTLTTQDTVYTHPTTSGNKHIPSGGSSGQFLGWDSDGTAKWVNNPNTNTDTLMTQNVSSTDAAYPLLLCPTANATANQGAKTGIFSSKARVNASTGEIITDSQNGIRFRQSGESKYSSFIRNDGGSTYWMVTAANTPDGTWTSARPLTINNSTGVCSINGNAATATKATNNANGKELTNTIIKGLSISGKTITYTQIDGSTGTLTTQDTNTDTLMTQNVSTTNSTYPVLLCPTANATSNQGAKTGIFAKSVKINPNTNTLYTSNLIYSGSLYQYKSGYTKGGTFSSNVYLGNAYCDTAGTALSDILYYINTTKNGGSAAICFRVHGNPNYTGTNTAQEPSLGVGVTKDNTIYTFAPTPATSSNDTNIATTAWVRARVKDIITGGGSTSAGGISPVEGTIISGLALSTSVTYSTAIGGIITTPANLFYAVVTVSIGTGVITYAKGSAVGGSGTWKLMGGCPTSQGNANMYLFGIWVKVA